MKNLIFLKMGGSLITDKDKPYTARPGTIKRLAQELKRALTDSPETHILLGHGSGSFGHVAGKAHSTRQGVKTHDQWLGFVNVWKAARTLNQILTEIMLDEGLPVISFPPSAMINSEAGNIIEWNLDPIQQALHNGLIPIVYGDVVFDRQIGGTILSTEELFSYLAYKLKPQKLLLSGIVPGVFADFPICKSLIPKITPESRTSIQSELQGSAWVDVTGGMLQKVDDMLSLSKQLNHLEAIIFSGEKPENLYNVVIGSKIGTIISHQ
jgi:isopentenyl phosphate kinase